MSDIIESFDPSSGELLGTVEETSTQSLSKILARVREAAVPWKESSFGERLRHIERAYAKAEASSHKLAELLSREMGKDLRRSTSEVQGCIWGGPYIAKASLSALQSRKAGETRIEYGPLGVVAVISPWNYPLAMANNLIIPALMAGNSVIWKPSEETPLIAQAFFESIKSGLPQDVLQIVHGAKKLGQKLVESDINMVAFTGSQRAGRDIMTRASSSLKRLVMELGGNDPLIVLKDADLASAARFAVASSFENAGQMCISTERIYVDAAVADDFEKLIVNAAGRYRVGPWNMEDVNIGPIINDRQHAKIINHIKDAKEKNGQLLLGGTEHPKHYILPTVISGMTPDMLIEQEETFGPVVCISRYLSLEDAVQRANNSDYGLGAVVFGGREAQAVAQRLDAGMIGINQGVGGGGDVPWVGAKQSGFGYHGSEEGHRQFAQVRVINE